MLLLDMFGAFTKLQDWEEDRQPIVWASNGGLLDGADGFFPISA